MHRWEPSHTLKVAGGALWAAKTVCRKHGWREDESVSPRNKTGREGGREGGLKQPMSCGASGRFLSLSTRTPWALSSSHSLQGSEVKSSPHIPPLRLLSPGDQHTIPMETKQKGAEALAWPPISPALLPRNEFCARREGRVRGLQAHLQKDKGSLGMAGNAARLQGLLLCGWEGDTDLPPYTKGSRGFTEGAANGKALNREVGLWLRPVEPLLRLCPVCHSACKVSFSVELPGAPGLGFICAVLS